LSLLWVPVTLVAAALQTARNATQRSLTESIGTLGATQVRFLYGLPFACLFLAVVAAVTGEAIPRVPPAALAFAALGAVTQIAATALMLTAMKEKSFSVTTAYIKTEPVLTAVVGLAVLGDRLTPLKAAGIAIATIGVLLMSVKRDALGALLEEARPARSSTCPRPASCFAPARSLRSASRSRPRCSWRTSSPSTAKR
jgi:drug/metabolite transporter (DMT)-like permease